MKLVVLVNFDSAANLALNYLLPELTKHDITVFYTDKTNSTKTRPDALKHLASFDKTQLMRSHLNLFARDDINVQCLNNINDGQDFATFKNSAPDLVISIRHMSILKPPTINIAKHGVINLHSGLLPNYQGVMATFWAMLRAERQIGSTLHWIEDAGIDTGAIIAHSITQTDFHQSYLWNVFNIYRQACENIVAAVEQLERGELITSEAQKGESRYFSFPQGADLRKADFTLYKQNDRFDDFLTQTPLGNL